MDDKSIEWKGCGGFSEENTNGAFYFAEICEISYSQHFLSDSKDCRFFGTAQMCKLQPAFCITVWNMRRLLENGSFYRAALL